VTVIAGLVDGDTVVIGGDSAGLAGWSLSLRADTKVFTNGPYVIGFSESFRLGQLMRHAFNAPALPTDVDVDRFMVTTWIDGLRSTLKSSGWARTDEGTEKAGAFLVAAGGRLWEAGDDLQLGVPLDGYAAVGCGANVALGSLHATRRTRMSAESRVRAALEASEHHSGGVRAPFTILRTQPAALLVSN
jgi:hypothetical protein